MCMPYDGAAGLQGEQLWNNQTSNLGVLSAPSHDATLVR